MIIIQVVCLHVPRRCCGDAWDSGSIQPLTYIDSEGPDCIG